MKKQRMFTAGILAGALILQLTGCSRGGSISPAELYAYAEDSGATVFNDVDDIKNSKERLSFYENDGVALYLIVTDLIDALEAKKTTLGDVNDFITDDMDEITVYMKRSDSDEQVVAMSASFFDTGDAEDLYEKYSDRFSVYNVFGVNTDEGESGGIRYKAMAVNAYDTHIGMGVYLDDTDVLLVLETSSEDLDELYEICDYLMLPMPQEDRYDED